jgi:Holliday junction resolvasome RuvABC endonuclease subunit
MVCAILTLPAPKTHDASDALALGLCHGQSRRLGLLLAAAEAGTSVSAR